MTTVPSSTGTPRAPSASNAGWIVPWIIACAMFMQNLDSTAVTTAVPAIARSFDVASTSLGAAVASYTLAVAIFLPASGWAADRFGARRIFAIAIGLFTLASAACGMANGVLWLVTARLAQGAAGSMMVPIGRLILVRSVPRDQLVAATARMTTPAILGPAIGPLVGGFLATYASWRSIFYINIPMGIAGILLVLRHVPDYPPPGRPAKFDRLGFCLSGIALGTIVTAAEGVGRGDTAITMTMSLMLASLLCGAAYLWHAGRVPHPVLALKLLRDRTFLIVMAAGLLFRMASGAVPFVVPMMLQIGFGLSPFAAGSIAFGSACGALCSKPFTRPLLERWGYRRLLVANAIASGLMLTGWSLFRPSTPHLLIWAALWIAGLIRSWQTTYVNTAALIHLDDRDLSQANTLSTVLQQIAISLGIAISASSLHLTALVSPTMQVALQFVPTFLLLGLLTLASAPLFAQLDQTVPR